MDSQDPIAKLKEAIAISSALTETIESMTLLQSQVFGFMAMGASRAETANVLDISEDQVRKIQRTIAGKMGDNLK